MLHNTLKKMGFEEKEAKLYLALLELGEAGVGEISLKSGLKRTTVYHVIEGLKSRGIVSESKKTKKLRYIAEDPRKIGEDIREKEAVFTKSLPELLSIANNIHKKPAIRYFEGFSGIKEVYRDELSHKDSEVLVWFSKSYEMFGDDFFFDYYVPKRLEKKIWIRVIAPDSEYMRKIKNDDYKFLRKTKLVSLEKDLMEVEISIYGKNKISIKSFEEKFALIIESKPMFNSMKAIFEMHWKFSEQD